MRQACITSVIETYPLASAHALFQAVYIGQCMVEIKKELKQENMGIKNNAIAKLLYVS